jgi:hypothetical protein
VSATTARIRQWAVGFEPSAYRNHLNGGLDRQLVSLVFEQHHTVARRGMPWAGLVLAMMLIVIAMVSPQAIRAYAGAYSSTLAGEDRSFRGPGATNGRNP